MLGKQIDKALGFEEEKREARRNEHIIPPLVRHTFLLFFFFLNKPFRVDSLWCSRRTIIRKSWRRQVDGNFRVSFHVVSITKPRKLTCRQGWLIGIERSIAASNR